MNDELDRIRARYDRRKQVPAARYSPLGPAVLMTETEKLRALARWVRYAGLEPVADKRVLEIGCGSGRNLLYLLLLGFWPENLVGNELLAERAEHARSLLPPATQILAGDAAELDLDPASFHVVLQSTVFSSILDDAFQRTLADRMWSLVKPGGGVLWYDFVYNNPRNPDVRGVPFRRVRALFPHARIKRWRLTLAPPLARAVARLHPALYSLLNAFPFLRTHILCWIQK